MDVTFVLEESGVTATVEVPCEADVAAAKEVACTALAVSPASVEMRIGTQVLEGTCRLQDTAFRAGVQVVLARRFADIKCPTEYNVQEGVKHLSLSRCGTLCLSCDEKHTIGGFDTETFDTTFAFSVSQLRFCASPAISQCKTRCYLACGEDFRVLALPGGEVLRKVDGSSHSVFACGGVVVSRGTDGVSVYDEDLTLLRSLSHERCSEVAVSDCGGWVIASSLLEEKKARLWDVNTGEAVACVPVAGGNVALSRSASVFAVEGSDKVHLYDWSGVAMGSFAQDSGTYFCGMQFTPCGKCLVINSLDVAQGGAWSLLQYDLSSMSCVREIPNTKGSPFAISPCSRVVVFENQSGNTILTRHLHPY